MAKKIITAGDLRDAHARQDAREIHKANRRALADAGQRVARMDRLYQEFHGSLHRLARMRAGRAYRALQAAMYGEAF